MRKLFATLLLTSLALPLHAQRSNAPASQTPPPRIVTPAESTEKPAAEKPQHSRSLMQRMFGSRPTPTPAPAPATEVKHHPKPKARPAPSEMPEEAVPKVAPKVAPKIPTPGDATAAKPKTGKGTGKKGAPATAVMATPVDDATKFKNAKAKAQEDPKITELKSKAAGEVNESDANKALAAYNRALFQKIREIDPSVEDYASKVEHALTKRLSAEKGKE